MSLVRYCAVSRIIVAALLFGLIHYLASGFIVSHATAQVTDSRPAGASSKTMSLNLNLPPQVVAQINAKGEDSDRGLLRIRGLPPSCSLNRGFVTANAWFVSLEDVKSLTLSTPEDLKGRLVLSVNLVKSPNNEPIRWRVPLEVLADPNTSQRPVVAESSVTATEAGASPLVPAKPSQLDRIQLERAQQLLQTNDVASARLVLKRLVKSNIAEAAFELAQTYDPAFQNAVQTSNKIADTAIALKWYERAARLGNQKAVERVKAFRRR
jgi:hypothetical protein